jgi:hypothetical protein
MDLASVASMAFDNLLVYKTIDIHRVPSSFALAPHKNQDKATIANSLNLLRTVESFFEVLRDDAEKQKKEIRKVYFVIEKQMKTNTKIFCIYTTLYTAILAAFSNPNINTPEEHKCTILTLNPTYKNKFCEDLMTDAEKNALRIKHISNYKYNKGLTVEMYKRLLATTVLRSGVPSRPAKKLDDIADTIFQLLGFFKFVF